MVTILWSEVLNYLAAALIVLSGALALVGAVGLLRLPDVFTRSHAASLGGTVGSSLALIAVAVSAHEFFLASRALTGVLFLLLTAPVAAHLIARAAYVAGYPICERNGVDAKCTSTDSQGTDS